MSPQDVRREAVKVEEVAVTLGESEILRGISTRFLEGELTAVIGPNGAGKSTLVRAILGLVTLSGRVLVGGRELRRLSPKELARTLAFVPQDTHLDFPFSVEELVLMGRYAHLRPLERERDVDRRVVAEALERLDLAGFRHRDVTTLSGGERQRVLIARALATEARILLADEPVSNLDIGHRLETLELLAELARAGYTVIAVLHDLDLALRYAGRVLLLDGGRVAAQGEPRAVIAGAELERAFGVRVEERDGTLLFERTPRRLSPLGPPPDRAGTH
jgi:iron complex transport system ATP-binding protein